jgi:hypothetical protein
MELVQLRGVWGSGVWADDTSCPYLVYDALGRTYWFSPVTMEPVVVQKFEGHA